MDLQFWYLAPIGFVIAVLGMSSGVSASNFWVPVFVIWLRIDPLVGFWLTLLTMIFGYGSGALKNVREKTVNWYLVRQYSKIVVPGSIVGTLLAPHLKPTMLLWGFAIFVFFYGIYCIHRCCVVESEEVHDKVYWVVGAVGSVLNGLVTTGLGKLILPKCIGHSQSKHHADAVGTVVVVTLISNIVAIIFRLTPEFLQTLSQESDKLMSIMVWVAPAVILGGQVGPMVAQRLKLKHLKVYVGSLLVAVSALIFLRVGVMH